jgi:hypothetical protein
MSEETRVIAEFVGGVFLVFITHQLTKSHYERKRRDDLADRESNRRLAAKDKRISDAQDYLNTYLKLTRAMMNVEVGLLTTGDADKYDAEYERIMDFTHSLSINRMISVFQLGDDTLIPLNIELISLAQKEYSNTVNLMLATKKKKL